VPVSLRNVILRYKVDNAAKFDDVGKCGGSPGEVRWWYRKMRRVLREDESGGKWLNLETMFLN